MSRFKNFNPEQFMQKLKEKNKSRESEYNEKQRCEGLKKKHEQEVEIWKESLPKRPKIEGVIYQGRVPYLRIYNR